MVKANLAPVIKNLVPDSLLLASTITLQLPTPSILASRDIDLLAMRLFMIYSMEISGAIIELKA